MGIIGLGTDIVAIERIKQLVERHPNRVFDRIFTPVERDYCQRFRDPMPHLAARFAAKEATYKALGGKQAIYWNKMWVENLPTGQPMLRLSDEPLRLAKELGANNFLVTLAHDGGCAIATVILAE